MSHGQEVHWVRVIYKKCQSNWQLVHPLAVLEAGCGLLDSTLSLVMSIRKGISHWFLTERVKK